MLVRIYTDGACSGNPGPGGYAAVIDFNGQVRVYGGMDKHTTNNRMELMAFHSALELAVDYIIGQDLRVEILTDSAYVYNAVVKGWVSRWCENDWMTKAGKPVVNDDIWRYVYEDLCWLEQQITIRDSMSGLSISKVKGHSCDKGNEMADEVAVKMRDMAREAVEAEERQR